MAPWNGLQYQRIANHSRTIPDGFQPVIRRFA
jgi:hypothetical protein